MQEIMPEIMPPLDGDGGASLKTHLGRLASLERLGQTVACDRDLDRTLRMILETARRELGLAAAAIFLTDPGGHVLREAFSIGLPESTRPRELLVSSIPEGSTGGYALCVAEDLDGSACAIAPAVPATHARRSRCVISLMAGPKVVGLLELYQRDRMQGDAEWFAFATTLAAQAAAAVELLGSKTAATSASERLSRVHDETVGVWTRALELRDKESGEHTRRVANNAVWLGRALGVDENELVHVRRGALLHDIGKLWIPDNILCKPGPLTPTEWAVMRRHPQDAYEMLSETDFLRPALDIPYSHHERWDGDGYPQKLRGTNIPLPARIFSVVDVWDALRSERPYAGAWSRPKARAYLENSSGSQFDPYVVDAFLRLEPELATC